MLRAFAVVPFLWFAACQSTKPTLPEGEGRGVLAADANPPAGAPTWPLPEWRVGDRTVLQLGDLSRLTLVVAGRLPDAYVLDNGSGPGGLTMRRGLDLSNLGDYAGNGEPFHLLSPADTRYHWPLWVGKRWQCEFVDRALGGEPMRMEASYVVEAVDNVTVPAGTIEALRIVRRVRLLDAPGQFLTRTQVTWYAPSLGIEVRALVGDTLVELVSFERAREKADQAAPAAR